MLKRDLVKLYTVLNGIKDRGDIKFRYAVIKNLRIVENNISALREIEDQMSSNLKPFTEKKNELIRKYGKESGGFIQVDVNDKQNYAKYNSAIESLNGKMKDLLDEHAKREKEYNTLLDTEVDSKPEFFLIDIDHVPLDVDFLKLPNVPDLIPSNNLEILMDMGLIK